MCREEKWIYSWEGNIFRKLTTHWWNRICFSARCPRIHPAGNFLLKTHVHVRAPPGLGPSMAMLIKPEEPCLQSHLQAAVAGHLKDRGCRLKLACAPPFNVTTAITWPLCTSKAWPDTHDLSPAPCLKTDLKTFFFFKENILALRDC